MPHTLNDFSSDELKEELSRREKKERPKPQPIQYPVWANLLKTCQDYIDFLASDEYHEDNDYDHYIFEAAMEAIYGPPDVWEDFINPIMTGE